MRRAFVIGFAVAAAWVMSCYSATEIELVIETDVPCEAVRARGVAIYVAGSNASVRANAPVATTNECTAGPGGSQQLGSLSLVPSGGRGERVFVDVVLGVDKGTADCTTDATGCIVARRAPRYIPHTSLRLPMRLSQRCASVACSNTETCEEGACVPLDSCGADGCGPGVDAGVADAALDAPGDAPSTGCAAGECVPQQVLSGIAMPTELAVAGDDVYVTSDIAEGGVVQGKTSGAQAPTVVASRLTPTGAVAADDTSLYFAAANVFLRVCDRPSCTNERRFNADSFTTLLLDPSSVMGVSQYNAYAIRMLKADGGTTLLTFSNPVAMAADANDAFFYVEMGTGNGILRCPLSGCVPLSPPPQLLSAAVDVRSMAVDDTYVYWAETDTGRVVRTAKTLAGGIEALTTTAKRPRSIVISGAFAYWTEEGVAADDGLVVSASKNGGSPIVVARGQHHPYRLVVAGGRLFWTNRVAAGTVLSLPLR